MIIRMVTIVKGGVYCDWVHANKGQIFDGELA